MAAPTLVQRVARLGNRYLGPVLGSPRLVRLLGREPIGIRYVGRRSGRTVELPAWARVTDDGLVVDVGAPSQKVWWRNFRSARPIDIRLDDTWRRGSAVVHEPRPGRVQVLVTWAEPPAGA